MTATLQAAARAGRAAILACLLIQGLAPALAAESEAPPPPDLHAEAEAETEAVAQADAAKTPAEADGPENPREPDPDTPEVFVPTEDISEDFSVRFPVDI